MNSKKKFDVLGKLPITIPSGLLKRISECDKTDDYARDFPSQRILKATWVIYDYTNAKKDLDSGAECSSGAGPTVFEFDTADSAALFAKALEKERRSYLNNNEDRSNTIWKAYFTEEIIKIRGLPVRHFHEKNFASRYSREIPCGIHDSYIFLLNNVVVDVRSAEVLINDVFGKRDYAGFGLELCREIIKNLKR